MSIKSKKKLLIAVFATVGLIIGLLAWAYANWYATVSPAPDPNNLPLLSLSLIIFVLCPPSLLTVPLIDVEPGSMDFAVIWIVVAMLNSLLYAWVGTIAYKFFVKRFESSPPHPLP